MRQKRGPRFEFNESRAPQELGPTQEQNVRGPEQLLCEQKIS